MSEHELKAGIQIGDFRIEKQVGVGGMGIVYQARQMSLNRIVALKFLGRPLTRAADMKRFQREARAAAKLNHPGIATIHFVGQDNEVSYMAMEFIDGVSLRDVIDRLGQTRDSNSSIDSAWMEIKQSSVPGGTIRFDELAETAVFPVSGGGDDTEQQWITAEAEGLIAKKDHIRRSCDLIRDAVLALDHAHKQGVIHRDLKPGNLMLDREGKMHIIDFGLARFFEDATVTETGQLVGTPMYMSPEQVTGRIDLDHRTDIYSLGLVLHELLALRPPIVAPTREGILRNIVTRALPPISWQNASIPQDLEGVVHKAIAKDPDERYQSAAQFAEELQRILDGKLVETSPYRYKLDEQEILAARPTSILNIGVMLIFIAFCFLAGGFGFLSLVSYQFFLGVTFDPWWQGKMWLSVLISTLVLFLGIGIYTTGKTLLAGRMWAKWTAIGIAVILAVALMAFFGRVVAVDLKRSGNIDPVISVLMFTLVLLVTIAVVYVIWRLQHRKTNEWLRFAQRLRTEYKQKRGTSA